MLPSRITSGSRARRPPGTPVFGPLELAFEDGPAAGRVDDAGRIDFLERGLLKPVLPGQLLGRLLPPPAPPEGDESPVTPSPPPLTLRLGPGASLETDGTIRARHAGVILHEPGAWLDVVERHVHRGRVDLRSGHLEMQGSLSVEGDVERLLQVRVSGDLEVLGSVSGGSLRAGGSIRVSGSVRGGDGGSVVAESDAALHSCESATVAARGVLRVQEAVNSRLSACEVVVSGRLRGGSATAELYVVVKEAGTKSGTPTLLHAGVPLELPALEDVQRAVMMQKLRRMAERGGVREASGSRGDSRGKGGKLGRIDAALSAEEQAARVALAERRAALLRSASVRIGLAHAGVEVQIGSARLQLEQESRSLCYALSPETGQLALRRTAE